VTEPPQATVVVATRNRRRRLEALLAGLTRQDGVAFETIVVDDGSTDTTPALLSGGVDGLSLQVVRNDRPLGRAAARNAGWPLAQSDLVVFTDDDVVPEAGWLAALVDAHRSHADTIIQGRTEPDPEEVGRSRIFWRSIRVEELDELAPTCNIAYPSEMLRKMGGFDPGHFKRMGEDTDLAWRARKAGADLVFVDSARARHAVHQPGLVGALRDTHRTLDMVPLVRRHPEVRRALHRGLFVDPHHEPALALALGLALSRRTRGGSLLLALPYAATYRRHHANWPRTLAALPAYALVDLFCTLALAGASARHATPVL